MEKLETMSEERRSVLCQFYCMVACLFARISVQALYLYADLQAADYYAYHATY